MRIFLLLLSVLTFINCLYAGGSSETASLFPIYEKGYYGFVNEKGRMLIKPRFQQVGLFYEGLAPVKEKDHFGYIDTKGNYVIEPRFDQAGSFHKGFAEVHVKNRKYLIDRQGQIQFEHIYKDWNWAGLTGDRDLLVVTTINDRQGVADLQGRLIVDTIYKKINRFSEGLATVVAEPEGLAGKQQVGLINTQGDIIVPFGRFDDIRPFHNGFAAVIQQEQKGTDVKEIEGVIDVRGEIQFLLADELIGFSNSEPIYQDGLAEIAIYPTEQEGASGPQTGEPFSYRGMMDAEGNIVFSHPRIIDITPFANGRAFAKTTDFAWLMIDRQGKRVGKDYYLAVPEEGFRNGQAVVQLEEGLSLIDVNGAVLQTADLQTTYYHWRGDAVFYEVEILIEDTYERRWGFWDLNNKRVQAARFSIIDWEQGFQNDVARVEEKGREGYFSRKGKYVWRAKK